jgi:hypothetical protein
VIEANKIDFDFDFDEHARAKGVACIQWRNPIMMFCAKLLYLFMRLIQSICTCS